MRSPIKGAMRWVLQSLIFPFLYFATMLPVVVGIAVAFSSIEYGGFLYEYLEPLYRYDEAIATIDITGLAPIFVIGGLIFGLCAWLLIRLEGLRHPKLVDHLRHCAYLYIFFIALSAILIPDYLEGLRLGYPGVETQGQVVWLVSAFAILTDALTLIRRRWLVGRIEHGGTH